MIEALKCIQPPPPLTIPRRANGFTTQIFWDSDIGKWVEAASYALGHGRDADIEAKIDEIVDLYEAAQLPDGYLNTWYIGREIENRWTNLRDNHELYNCRPSARGRHRLLPGDGAAEVPRHHGALRRPHRDGVRARAGAEARLSRARRDRDRADQALLA